MSLIAGAMGKQKAIAEEHQIKEKIGEIRTALKDLTSSNKDLINAGSDMDPSNPAVKQLEQRKERLSLLEKKLDMEMSELKDRLEIVEKEKEYSEKLFSDGVASIYK